MAGKYNVCKDNGEMFGPEEVWKQVDLLCPHTAPESGRDSGQRRGWKTVRIFVSSTFKDFHHEREVLVKQVFPDLRRWCQQRKLHLVECDLRWGAPAYFTSEDKVKLCLDEIKRCYDENHKKPFFINMTSKRVGWIPKPDESEEKDRLNFDVLREFKLVFGLSITEMEIVYGGYSITNPNALFLLRDNSFFDTLPPDKNLRQGFDYDDLALEKIPLLKAKLKSKFHKNKEAQFLEYSAKFNGYTGNDKKVKLEIHHEEKLCDQILEFFQERIGLMYPPFTEVEDKFVARRLEHEAFMGAKAQDVLGREEVLGQISEHIRGKHGDVPLLLLGKPGIGKSSIMAKAAQDAESSKSAIAGGSKNGWHVFYHFVGAVPGSTELLILLHRILKDITDTETADLPSDIEECVATTNSALNKDSCPPVILYIDALNQLDEDHPSVGLVNWLPRKLSDRVRCVFAMVPDSAQHKSLMGRESKPRVIEVSDLNNATRQKLIEQYLARYNKKLEGDQMNTMLKKTCTVNPLWLTIACEELRVHGNFRTVTNKIENLANDLNGILEQVLSRFETEGDAVLVKATLCLIEVSKRGLLETELIYILGDIYFGKLEKSQSKDKAHYSDEFRLPALQWTQVTRALGTLLRPFGGLNEGRLDFYHRTVSKAVRNKYLQKSKLEWHKTLAHFFQHCSLPLERRVEEYPYHLTCLADSERLKVFLAGWDVFDLLYNREFSVQLLEYWKHCGGSESMAKTYNGLLQSVPKDQKITKHEQVGRVCLQAGQYEDSLVLAEQGLKLVQRQDDLLSLVAFYTLLSDTYDHKYKALSVIDKKDLPIIKEALKYSDKSVDVWLKLKKQDKKHTKFYGQYLMRHAFNYGAFAELGGDNHMSREKASETGLKYIEDAIKLFEQLDNKGLLAEAHMTKGVLDRDGDLGKQKKSFKKAEELCKEVYGDTHLLMPRILKNMANAYADNGYHKDAFGYYLKCLQLYHQLFGADHPKTKSTHRAISFDHFKTRFGEVQMDDVHVYVVSLDKSTRTMVK